MVFKDFKNLPRKTMLRWFINLLIRSPLLCAHIQIGNLHLTNLQEVVLNVKIGQPSY